MPLSENDIEYIVQNHKWKLTLGFVWARYFLMIAPLGFIVSAFTLIVVGLTEKNKYTTIEWLLLSLAFLLPGSLFGIFYIKRVEAERKFISLKRGGIPKGDILHLIRNLRWTIFEKNPKYIIAYTYGSAFSWGEEITILFNEDEILFNSKPRGSQPFTFNRDRINTKKFRSELENSIL